MRMTALNVKELLSSEIASESGFRNGILAERHRRFGGGHGIAPVGDVGKGAAVHKGRRPFGGLNEIRLYGFQKKRHHGSRRTEFFAGKGRFVELVAENEVVDTAS